MIPEEFVRIIIKNSTVPSQQPTIPLDDNDIDSFLSTDIFEGELFFNINDEILYTRSGSNIINLNTTDVPVVTSVTSSITLGSSDIYEVSTSTNNLTLTLPNPAGKEIIIKKMDSGGSIDFDQLIDGQTLTMTNINECITIFNDGTEWILLSQL
jgi:hypothetical protein